MLHTDIQKQITEAMKKGETEKLNTLRSVLARATQKLGETGKKPNELLEDTEMMQVIRSLIKQRQEAQEAYEKAQRQEQAEAEKREQKVLEALLPPPPSEEEVRTAVKEEARAQGDTVHRGKLTGAVMKRLGVTADGKMVQRVIAETLE